MSKSAKVQLSGAAGPHTRASLSAVLKHSVVYDFFIFYLHIVFISYLQISWYQIITALQKAQCKPFFVIQN